MTVNTSVKLHFSLFKVSKRLNLCQSDLCSRACLAPFHFQNTGHTLHRRISETWKWAQSESFASQLHQLHKLKSNMQVYSSECMAILRQFITRTDLSHVPSAEIKTNVHWAVNGVDASSCGHYTTGNNLSSM